MAGAAIDRPMTAFTRDSGPNPHVVLPPAIASEVADPRECPHHAGARGVDTIDPNHPGRASRTLLDVL